MLTGEMKHTVYKLYGRYAGKRLHQGERVELIEAGESPGGAPRFEASPIGGGFSLHVDLGDVILERTVEDECPTVPSMQGGI